MNTDAEIPVCESGNDGLFLAHARKGYPLALAVVRAAQLHHGHTVEPLFECRLCLAIDAWNEAE